MKTNWGHAFINPGCFSVIFNVVLPLLRCMIPLPSVVYPGPRGHIFLNWVVPGRGQISQFVPQPLPPSQQHSDLVTICRLLEVIWHRLVRTSVKQKPSRLSGEWDKHRSLTEKERRGPDHTTQIRSWPLENQTWNRQPTPFYQYGLQDNRECYQNLLGAFSHWL